jgi:hypothetical protein
MKKTILFLFAFLIGACAPAAPALPTHTAVPQPTAITTNPSTPVSSSEPAFPRLGMWWPNPYEQPLEKIARYDWVILGDWSRDFLGPLRALNPKMRLLTSTNACELAFEPGNAATNQPLENIPPQWFLTQVGSTLRADVDATQTMIPVETVTIKSQTGEIALFVAGDAVLIEGESVYVTSVDKANRVLTVQRGYIRSASAHKAGARIAAHISFWPNSWLLNVSTLSPVGIADPAIGLERWADYNARLSARLLVDPRWDGLLVDRTDPNESWLIGNSTARSIDPDQSNRLLDDYRAFDAAWNAGLRSYLDQLRAAIGPKRIIFLNWGIPHYAAVNGNNFEGFPSDHDQHPWRAQTFGPTETGSYFEWMKQSRQPNLTMVETYEDNSGPKPDDTDGYPNRCNQPTFTPNYRKMRFGLTTALLNDGYFSYEMNTEGHGSLCLLWFDEYDNVGAGRGYLGYPLGPAQRVVTGLSTPNLLSPIRLDSGKLLSPWSTWTDTGYSLSVSADPGNPAIDTASTRLDILQAQGSDYRASFSFSPLRLSKGADYTLTFYARADHSRTIGVWVQQDQDPWQAWLLYGNPTLTTAWQKFELPATAQGDDDKARLTFGLGTASGSVWLDRISLQQGNTDVWRRDFEHGIVLVNSSSQPVTIPLGGVFVKINGAQDRTVNDGATVTEITLPPQDGIILLYPK